MPEFKLQFVHQCSSSKPIFFIILSRNDLFHHMLTQMVFLLAHVAMEKHVLHYCIDKGNF